MLRTCIALTPKSGTCAGPRTSTIFSKIPFVSVIRYFQWLPWVSGQRLFTSGGRSWV